MKVSKEIENKMKAMTKLTRKLRVLSHDIITYLENKGVDTYAQDFENAWGYIEGDCSIKEIMTHLKSL